MTTGLPVSNVWGLRFEGGNRVDFRAQHEADDVEFVRRGIVIAMRPVKFAGAATLR